MGRRCTTPNTEDIEGLLVTLDILKDNIQHHSVHWGMKALDRAIKFINQHKHKGE